MSLVDYSDSEEEELALGTLETHSGLVFGRLTSQTCGSRQGRGRPGRKG